MRKSLVMTLAVMSIVSCTKGALIDKNVQDDTVGTLTEKLIYGEDDGERIKALNDLTGAGVQARYNAIREFVNAVEKKPDLFPKDDPDREQSLLKEIITARLNDTASNKNKEYVKERMNYLSLLNRLLRFGMQYKIYYEVAEMLYQKYVYGALWYRESLDIYKNKTAAVEFEHARNAALANLQLLSKIVKEGRTLNFINKCLSEIEKR